MSSRRHKLWILAAALVQLLQFPSPHNLSLLRQRPVIPTNQAETELHKQWYLRQ